MTPPRLGAQPGSSGRSLWPSPLPVSDVRKSNSAKADSSSAKGEFKGKGRKFWDIHIEDLVAKYAATNTIGKTKHLGLFYLSILVFNLLMVIVTSN